MTDSSGSERFCERHAIMRLSDGAGIIVDLATGAYFKLNASALAVCEALEAESEANLVIARVVEKIGVDERQAVALIETVRTSLSQAVPREVIFGALSYEAHTDGSWLLSENGRQILSIRERDRRLELRCRLHDLQAPLALYLQAAVPKLLALLDVPVLHASACRLGTQYVAFSGRSGAGKTTTARAFARAGADLLSEDLLILTFPGRGVSFRTDGERMARGWARRVASELEANPDLVVDYSPLTDSNQGESLPLDAIWFVAAQRRGLALETRALTVSDGTLAILGNGFLASTYPRHWREFLSRAGRIAERVAAFEATMPEGIPNLERTAKSYIETRIS